MMLWSKYNWLCNLQLDFSLEVSFLSVVILLNPRFLISSTFLSISFSSLYSQPVLSQAENRFLNRQDSGDRAENHYWPRLGSIATTMASPDNRTDCHGYQIVNAHSRWKPLRPAFPFLKELCFKGKKIDIYSLFKRLQCLSTPHVTIKSKIGWEYSKCIVFFPALQATFLPFQRCLSFVELQHMVMCFYCSGCWFLIGHAALLYSSCMSVRQLKRADPIKVLIFYLGLKVSLKASVANLFHDRRFILSQSREHRWN